MHAIVKTPPRPGSLLADVRAMVLETRRDVGQGLNAALVKLYWRIGERIRIDILREKRADYGKQIVHSLSGQLTAEFGRGFARTNLFNMVRFTDGNFLSFTKAAARRRHPEQRRR